MSKAISLFAIAAILFASCAPPSMVLVYKNRDHYNTHLHSILVAGVIQADDTVTRSSIENAVSSELKKAGYDAAPSLTAFGPGGLADLGQEETLLKLCNYGFDAVLVIALIDGSKERYSTPPGTHGNAASYYLDRIWNYEKIQADLSNVQDQSPHFWECILFDLYSLQPVGALQTPLYDVRQAGALGPDLAKKVIAKMVREKILRKQKSAKLITAQPIVKQ